MKPERLKTRPKWVYNDKGYIPYVSASWKGTVLRSDSRLPNRYIKRGFKPRFLGLVQIIV